MLYFLLLPLRPFTFMCQRIVLRLEERGLCAHEQTQSFGDHQRRCHHSSPHGGYWRGPRSSGMNEMIGIKCSMCSLLSAYIFPFSFPLSSIRLCGGAPSSTGFGLCGGDYRFPDGLYHHLHLPSPLQGLLIRYGVGCIWNEQKILLPPYSSPIFISSRG